MKSIIGRFSANCRQILVEAQKLAESNKIELKTDCIILAFFSEIKTWSRDFLINNNITKELLFKNFTDLLNNSKSRNSEPNEIVKILQDSAQNAFKFRADIVEPEHILLAIISDQNSTGFKLLNASQINTLKIKDQLFEFLVGIAELTNIEDEVEDMLDPESHENHLFLIDFACNLNQLALNGKLDPISSRDNELINLSHILCRRIKNNAIIIGEPGVGKTALVEGLAQAIVAKKVPKPLIDKNIWALDLARLVAGTTYRGQFEERLTGIIDEAKQTKNVILFIDELHTMVGSGNAEGSLDVAQILKPALAQGDFSVIGATTFEEYRKYLERDRALARRFSLITLNEPTKLQTFQILKNNKSIFEEFHRVKISDHFIKTAIDLAEKYLPDKFFPDKALDLIDEAASTALPIFTPNEEIEHLKQSLTQIIQEKLRAVEKNDFSQAKELKDNEEKIQNKLIKLNEDKKIKQYFNLDSQVLFDVLKYKTNLPIQNEQIGNLNFGTTEEITKKINSKIKGQEEAIKKIARIINATKLSHFDSLRPLASFIFIGPTGVGKTETAKIIAQKLFGDSKKLIKIDMSEYYEKHSISSLIGSPAGYVGYEDGGILTNAVRHNPFSAVLFDEIEKAHPDVFNLLLQILEDGYLTDNLGRKISFSNTIIILTSNLGNDDLSPGNIGFNSNSQLNSDRQKETNKLYHQELNEFLSPELLGRISEIVIFKSLDQKAVHSIFKIKLNQIISDLKKNNIQINILNASALYKFLIKRFNPKEGARSIDKIVNTFFYSKLLRYIERSPDQKKINIAFKNKIIFNQKA